MMSARSGDVVFRRGHEPRYIVESVEGVILHVRYRLRTGEWARCDLAADTVLPLERCSTRDKLD